MCRIGKKARVELVIIRQYGGDGVSCGRPIAGASTSQSLNCQGGVPGRGTPLITRLLLREDSSYAR